MTDLEIASLVTPTLKRHLSASGLTRISVKSGKDHDGDPSIFVDLYFEGQNRSIDSDALIAGMIEARRQVEARGDFRFLYPKLHVPDAEADEAA